jgi:fucose permease
MMAKESRSPLFILHPVFALTGVIQAVGGPLMPSLASNFHLSDSESGLLFALYFWGTALGALFCRANYGRTMSKGFAAIAAACLCAAAANRLAIFPIFLMLGIATGVPMSSIALYAGRNFADRRASVLTLLNFTWSLGALSAPLLAALFLAWGSFRGAFVALAVLAGLAALACYFLPADEAEVTNASKAKDPTGNLRLIALVAFMAFLQVGAENTAIAWFATYSLRFNGVGLAAASVSTTLYWVGFIASRGFSSLILRRVEPMQVLRAAVLLALLSGSVLAAFPVGPVRGASMFGLGVALAPIYPLLIALLFARARRISDTRWVLATCGYGGSALPWLTGWISMRSGSLSLGLLTIPVALLLMALLLPVLSRNKSAQA